MNKERKLFQDVYKRQGNERTVLLDKVNELLSELKDIFQGIYLIKDLSSKTSATIVSLSLIHICS